MVTWGSGRSWRRRGGTRSWYEGGWPHEGKARKKSPVGHRAWCQEMASSSKDGGKDGKEKGPVGKEDRAAMAKGYMTQEEEIWKLQRLLHVKNRCLRQTHEAQTQANDKVWELNETTEKALAHLGDT